VPSPTERVPPPTELAERCAAPTERVPPPTERVPGWPAASSWPLAEADARAPFPGPSYSATFPAIY
jgi:hypothetical protein